MKGGVPPQYAGLTFGRSDFGEFEARIRRLLSLEGMIPLEAGPNIHPVMVLGDGTLPGMGETRLRTFNISNLATGLNTGYWFKCLRPEGVIIDALEISPTVACQVVMRLLGPNDADPVVFNTATGMMMDRLRSSAEVSPLTRQAVNHASAVTALDTILLHNVPVGYHRFAIPFFLGLDAKVSVGATQSTQFVLRGRTF